MHRETVKRQWEKTSEEREATRTATRPAVDLFTQAPDCDDERAGLPDEQLEAEDAAQAVAAIEAVEAEVVRDDAAEMLWRKEQSLLDRMQEIAEESRHLPDSKAGALIDWLRDNLCPGLPELGKRHKGSAPKWNDRRVLIFTENRQGTKRWLKAIIEQAIDSTDDAENRIEVIDGLTSRSRRKEIQRRFNTDPSKDPLRILLATDAAREGLNFQAHCTDLFHFDLPWNPGRIEQRNGRIDRKLQPADEVRCHYFVLPQRVEDRVLDVLVRKTETIKAELGSLSRVINHDIGQQLKGGIRHKNAEFLAIKIKGADLNAELKRVTSEELEANRDRQEDLKSQIERCQTLLERSRRWLAFQPTPFRSALSCSLELLGSEPLKAAQDEQGRPIWTFPALDRRAEADPSWTGTLDTLRVPRKTDQKLAEWRREAPIRPVIFEDSGVLTEDTVHLHLEQRVAQRLLARFRTQGFVHHDLSRACLTQVADSIPRVMLLGRLSLYGRNAERLHEEIVPVAARWVEPSRRDGSLKPYAIDAELKTLELLEASLSGGKTQTPDKRVEQKLLESAAQDIHELLPKLEPRANGLAKTAEDKLKTRGVKEAESLHGTLVAQRKRVVERLGKHEKEAHQLTFDFNLEEKRQLEADVSSWRMRLKQFDRDLETEPDRIKEFYEIRARRVEPVGLVYLWPESN